MTKLTSILKKLFERLLSFLRVRVVAAGLEVSDQVLRLVQFDGEAWQTHAVRLEPGVLEGGKVKDREAFLASLRALKASAAGASKKKLHAILSLSSLGIYSQVFSLPQIGGEELEKAIELNVQMLSPVDFLAVYSGSQIVGKSSADARVEVLAAFADKATVDDLTQLLFLEGFVLVAVESRALALARVVREQGAGMEAGQSYLVVNIDNIGIDFLVLRGGQLYFEYSSQWRDMTNEKGEVPMEKFQTTLTASLRQVFNFYHQHWQEPVGAILLSATALSEEAKRLMEAEVSLPVLPLVLKVPEAPSPEWLVAFGSALRGAAGKDLGKEANLLGDDARATFQEEQFLHFFAFWRLMVPVALGVLILTFFIANLFLERTRTGIEMQSGINLGSTQAKEVADLQARAAEFNRSVALVRSAENAQNFKYRVVSAIIKLAASNGVTIGRFSFASVGTPASLAGIAPSRNQIVAFKNAIEADARFGKVSLPLTAIQANGDSFSFSMTFPLSASAFNP